MADSTLIEWARHPSTGKGATWQIVTGCQIVSPGCTNCYAMKLAGTRLRNHPSRAGLTLPSRKGPVWAGQIRFNEEWLAQPLRWRDPRGIFVAAHGDLFAEGVTDDMLDRIFAVMALAPQHIFFVLTKRPGRMRDYMNGAGAYNRILRAADPLRTKWPRLAGIAINDPVRGAQWPHVWLGTSAENQDWADLRLRPMEDLAAMRWTTFVSYEPAIGPIDWTGWEFLKWMISGGESGPRPSHPDWHRATRDFCAAHGIAYFFKQWGNWAPAPWTLDRQWDESDDEFKARSDEAATHAIKRWDGYVHKPDHKSWSVERSSIDDHWAGIRHFRDKKDAGHLLDGREHYEFPGVRA
jgi:protein gp37